MEFSTIITILVYALMCRLTIGSLASTITKSLLKEDFKYNLRWLNKYMIRKSAYKDDNDFVLCYRYKRSKIAKLSSTAVFMASGYAYLNRVNGLYLL